MPWTAGRDWPNLVAAHDALRAWAPGGEDSFMAKDLREAQSPAVSGNAAGYRDRPWLALYPPDVPAEIELDKVGTIVDLFQRSVTAHGERPAYTSFGSSLSYAKLGRHAADFAAWLRA